MLESFPLTEALPMIFRGTGDCTKVLWRFLGLSIAEWSLICFAILVVTAIAAAMLKPRR
jgi:disulfide bond formation protein DsbB